MLVVLLGLAQLDEQAVRLARVDPRDVGPAVIDPRALLLQMLDPGGHVLGVEADEVHALALLRKELADGLGGIGGLHQLDVALAERQDRVLEAELLRLAALVHGEPEEFGVARDRGVQIAHDHADLDSIAQDLLHQLFSEPTTPTNDTHSPGAPPRLWVSASLRPRATLAICRLPAS